MVLQPVWDLLERDLFDTPGPEGLFNPYHDHDARYDQPDAVATRRANLRSYLAAYPARPPLFLLAEAPGPWGCRFSGVPITSEAQLVGNEIPIPGRQSSLNETPHTEYSASIYWRVVGSAFPHFFTWNSVPFHPYKPDQPLSIRNPGNREVRQFGPLLHDLLALLRPERILAIGRKAEHVLTRLDQPCTYVRHPSQGGAKRFEAGVHETLHEMGL